MNVKFRLNVLYLLLFSWVTVLYSQSPMQYEFETAYVEKTTTTNSTGIETTTFEQIYITEKGNKVASYKTEKRKISMMGQNQVEESKTVSIRDGSTVTAYNPETLKGTRMKLNTPDNLSGMSEGDAQQFAEQMSGATNTEVIELGSEEVAGKICNKSKAVTDLMGMKITTTTWMYKNFLMKSESEGNGPKVTEIVTKFDEGVSIDTEKLKVPSNVVITEINSPY